MAIEVKMIGGAELAIAIEGLSAEMKGKTMKAALMRAAKPVVRQAQANAPILKKPSKARTPGLMRALTGAFYSRIHKGQNGVIGVYIKPRVKKKSHIKSRGILDPFYYRFIEAGFHAVGRRKIGGGKRIRPTRLAERVSHGTARKIEGVKFLGRAYESAGGTALREFGNALAQKIRALNMRKK